MSFLSMLNMARGKEPEAATPPASRQSHNSGDATNTVKAAKPATNRPGSSNPAAKRPEPPALRKNAPGPVLYTPSPTVRAKPTTPSAVPRISKPPTPSKPLRATNLTPTGRNTNRSPLNAHTKVAVEPAPAEPVSRKKLSFKDVLKKADSIDRSKFEISLTSKTPKKDIARPARRRTAEEPASPDRIDGGRRVDTPKRAEYGRLSDDFKSSDAVKSSPYSRSAGRGRPGVPDNNSTKPSTPARPRSPAAFAQPFPELAAKMQQRAQLKDRHRRQMREKRRYDDDDDDLGDFIVSEDDEDLAEYSSEIRNLYRRSNGADRYESDSESDMEAGGADILDEERRSAAQARREDILEEQKLAERASQKRKRLH